MHAGTHAPHKHGGTRLWFSLAGQPPPKARLSPRYCLLLGRRNGHAKRRADPEPSGLGVQIGTCLEQLCERARDELRRSVLRSICFLRASAMIDLNLAVLLVVLADPPSDPGTTAENWDLEGVGGVENEDGQ